MSIVDKVREVGAFTQPIFSNAPSKRKVAPAKKARFAKMCMHVVKWCVEADNLAMIPVIGYLSLNSYNPEWKYNTAAIQEATGLDRKTVAKCLVKLQGIGVLAPIDANTGRGSFPRSVKPYKLNLARFLELFETIAPDSNAAGMGIESPFLEKPVSTSMGIQSTCFERPFTANMGIESQGMGIQSQSIGIESPYHGYSVPINRIEIENAEKKELIPGDNVLFSPSSEEEDLGDYDMAFYNSLIEEDIGDYGLAGFESETFLESTKPGQATTISPFVCWKDNGKRVVDKFAGRALKDFIEWDKQVKEKQEERKRRDRLFELFYARQDKYRSPRLGQEDLTVLPVNDKALCLKEGIKSLSLTGLIDESNGHHIAAPVFADGRGVTLAESLFESNPRLTASDLLQALEYLCVVLHYNPKEDGKWDDYVVERKCMKLSYFINYLQELVSKHENVFSGFGLTPALHFVSDVDNKPAKAEKQDRPVTVANSLAVAHGRPEVAATSNSIERTS